MKYVTVEVKLVTSLGEFTSERMRLDEDKFNELTKHAKSFWEGGYDMWLPTGLLVVPPEVIRKSILIIKILENE